MESVDPSGGVFVTAEGLLMYLQPEQALGLIAQCAKRFPGGRMLFDVPSPLVATMGRQRARISRRYKGPPMPFRLSVAQVADLVNTMPGVRTVRDLQLPPGRSRLFSANMSIICRKPVLAPLLPCMALLEIG
jgi:O-methyltransferase involved in polyketide biosynthesis